MEKENGFFSKMVSIPAMIKDKTVETLATYIPNKIGEADDKQKCIISELKEEIAKLKTENENLLSIKIGLNAEIKNLTSKVLQNVNYIEFLKNSQGEISEAFKKDQATLKNQIELLQKELDSKAQKSEKNEEISLQTEKYNNLKKKYKKLKTEVQAVHEENKNLLLKIKQAKDIKKSFEHKQEKIIEELTLENTKLSSKYEEISKKYKESQQIIKEYENNLTRPKKKTKKKFEITLPYDFVINIDSLKTQSLGWEIEKSPNYHPEKKSVTAAGLIGRENVGKTFILSKLCGLNLPNECIFNTKGLSIISSPKTNAVFLDSAGLQKPVYYFDQKLLQRFSCTKEDLKNNEEIKNDMINDRTLTDLFIQDFILEFCAIIIIVVGLLSQNDQKFIQRISKKYKGKKRIIIIHNFLTLKNPEDIAEQIKNDIFLAFDNITARGIPNSDVLEYIEKSSDITKNNISHLILGAENGESGLKYNEISLQHLRKILETCTEKAFFDPIANLTEFFEENYQHYLQFQRRPKEKVTLEYDQKKSKIQIKSDSEYMVSHPIFNTIGDFAANPPFDLYFKDHKYALLIEISSLDISSLEVRIIKNKNEFQMVGLKGVKKTIEAEDSGKLISQGRGQREFEYLFPICKLFEKIEYLEKEMVYENGVLKLFFLNIEEEEEQIN